MHIRQRGWQSWLFRPAISLANQKVPLSRVSVGTECRVPNCPPAVREGNSVKAILFVLAMGTVASAAVEAIERWRRYQARKHQRGSTR